MKKIITILLFLHVIKIGFSQNNENQIKLQSVFIYNFTKYIEWTPAYKAGNFVIGIMGQNQAITKELEKIAQNKTVNKQNIIIKEIRNTNDIGRCHILFLPHESNYKISDLHNKILNSNTLLISEKEGGIQEGATINFVVRDGKQKFELSKRNATKQNLYINNTLINLGITID